MHARSSLQLDVDTPGRQPGQQVRGYVPVEFGRNDRLIEILVEAVNALGHAPGAKGRKACHIGYTVEWDPVVAAAADDRVITGNRQETPVWPVAEAFLPRIARNSSTCRQMFG